MKKFNYRSMLRSAARKIWMWSPDRREAIRTARVAPGTLSCATCGKRMKENPKDTDKEYRVDHIVPASEPAAKIHDWNDFYKRLLECGPQGLQILCDACHDVKTQSENLVRRSVKRKRTIRRKKSNG